MLVKTGRVLVLASGMVCMNDVMAGQDAKSISKDKLCDLGTAFEAVARDSHAVSVLCVASREREDHIRGIFTHGLGLSLTIGVLVLWLCAVAGLVSMTGMGRYPANHATSPALQVQAPPRWMLGPFRSPPFPLRSARPTHLQNLRRRAGWHAAPTGRWIDRSQQVTATPGSLQRVGSRLPWHSTPCSSPCLFCFPLHSILSVSIIQPFFHQGVPIEADGISHFPLTWSPTTERQRRPRGGSAETWNHSSQSGRGNRGATQPRNTSAASLTQQQGVPLSLPQPRRKTLETLSTPRHHPPAKPTPQNRARKDIAPLRPAIPLVSPRLVDTSIEHK